MTDKVQKIRKGIERLKSQLIKGACASQIAMETMCKEEAYNEVLAILDSLQEEPKKCMFTKDSYTDEDRKVLCDGCEEDCEYAQKEEPVSEDLEKASIKYAQDKYMPVQTSQAFKAGAKWQKQKDQAIIELAEDHAMLAGMEKMKEEMMAKAVDGDITFDYYDDGDKIYGCIAHDSFCLEDFGLKDRDKVKVIVIKED